jgi:regulatory protein
VEEAPSRRRAVITGLTPDTRAPGYLVVEVDGARFTSLPAELVDAERLAAGDELDEQRFAALAKVADEEAAYQVAVRILALRPRSVREILMRLRDRGQKPSAAQEAVRRLETKGLLNDEEFARHFVRVRSAKGHGPSRLITDLLARGVDKGIAEEAVHEVLDDEAVNTLEQARLIAEKRSGQLGDLPLKTKRRRIVAYLARRGYHGYEVREIVTELLKGRRE